MKHLASFEMVIEKYFRDKNIEVKNIINEIQGTALFKMNQFQKNFLMIEEFSSNYSCMTRCSELIKATYQILTSEQIPVFVQHLKTTRL
jgi:hypothetical protein